MAFTIRDLITESLQEIGVIGATETPAAADAAFALAKLNRLFDNWNAEREAVFAPLFLSLTIQPNAQPVTIGPTGHYVVSQRPVLIEGANVILNNVSPSVQTPITIRDVQWWLGQSIPGVTSQYPTDLYYEPDFPNGKIFLWPVPTVAYGLQLLVRIVLASVALNDAFSFPPGYRDAVTLTLAEDLIGPFGAIKRVSPTLPIKAAQARARIFGVNVEPPRLTTLDSGMPSGRPRNRSNWNYRTGLFN